VAALVLVGAALPRTRPAFAQGGQAAEELYGAGGLLGRLPPRSVLLCESDDACAVTWFAQHAEGMRPDVYVVPAPHLWDANLRKPLADLGLTVARHDPPSAARRALADATARHLASGALPRPIYWEGSAYLRAAGHVGPLAPAAVAPLLVADGAQARVMDALRTLEELVQRRGLDREASPRARGAVARMASELGAAGLTTDPHSSVRAFAFAARWDPTAAPVWTNLGSAYAAAGELPLATQVTQHAISLEPRRPAPWLNLERYALAAGDPARAREVAKIARALGVDPGAIERVFGEGRAPPPP